MRSRRAVFWAATLPVALLAGACEGSTIVIETPQPSESSPASSPSSTSPHTSEPDPTGWWPPPPPPTTSPDQQQPSPSAPDPTSQAPDGQQDSPTPEEPQTEAPSSQAPQPEDDDKDNEDGPDTPEPFTFPRWEEFIYQSRNGERPEQFKQRERYLSCGDFASEEGADLLSPDVAECLSQGESEVGKESAIAVRLADGGVHVWFVRVGPEIAEYFVDRTHAGSEWVYAKCASDQPIGVLACEEPTTLEENEITSTPSPTPEPEQSSPQEEPSPPDEEADTEEEPSPDSPTDGETMEP